MMRALRPFLGVGFLMLLPAFLSACPIDGDGPDGGPGDDFDDHSAKTLATVARYEAFAAQAASSTAVKFVITGFLTNGAELRFLDGAFYTLHDEWYWFRLLNGAAIDHVDTVPVNLGRSFETIRDIYDWARAQSALPLDLTFVGDGRLYSPRFYQLALFSSPKTLGIGTVLHFRARPDAGLAEQWAIELEYQHVLSEEELAAFFAMLERGLPAEVGTRLKLLVRSPQHEQLARQLEANGSPLAARILRYSDVTVPGEIEVYSEGLIAGRLKVIRSGEGGLESTRSTDVLVVEDVPDFLPQCAGLITAVPQTALAHVNILAKNRGIPNAYRGGVLDDPLIDQLARVSAPVIVRATAPDRLEIAAMTEAEFSQFRQLTAVPPSAVPPVDLTGVDVAYDLTELDFADQDRWRPVLGGKSAGYLALLDALDVTTPPRPVGISIKPYVNHVAPLRPRLEAMLQDPAFINDPLVRLLVLEGPTSFRARRPDRAQFPQQFALSRPPTDALRALVDQGGVQGIIRSTPMDAADLAAVVATLTAHFGDYADEQGLRFRSSSNVEDAEGFNGAGLYTSNTGFLRAERLSGSKREKTVERAIKETWASYWGSEAFEERRLANVAHLSGAMGLVVHANFQDSLELGNGVFTYTILPGGRAVLELNAQEGALSVTNPPPGDENLPEVDRLTLADGVVTIERVRGSTLLPAGSHVLNDAQLRRVFDEARRVAELWLDVENAALPASQQKSTLTLDFELREVAAGWPMYASGPPAGARVVIKQARTLEPSLVRVPSPARSMPIPRDVLARALKVEQRACTTEGLRVIVTEVLTDPRKPPDLGYAQVPFTAFALVEAQSAQPALGMVAGQRRSVVHTAFDATRPSGNDSLDIVVRASAVAQVGLSRITLLDDVLTVERDGGVVAGAAECGRSVLFASPEAFLEAILERP